MDNHQWRLSQAYTYALYISKHIFITLIPYHLIFILHVKLFLLLVLCLWHIPLSILFSVFLFIYFTYSYTYHVFIFHACHMSFQCSYSFSGYISCLQSMPFSSFGSMIYCILCIITYIIPYLSHIICLFLVTCLYRILSFLFLVFIYLFSYQFILYYLFL